MASYPIKDTHWEKAPSNETPALTKSTNMGIWVVGTTNQLFLISSFCSHHFICLNMGF